MNVTGRYGNDAKLRQILESVKMNKIKKDELMNSKTEWNDDDGGVLKRLCYSEIDLFYRQRYNF
jgi:hypothetical protein